MILTEQTLAIPVSYIPEPVYYFKPGAKPVYMLTVAPGLEHVAADEAETKLNTQVRALMRGKVFLSYALSTAALFPFGLLRCADNVYAFLYAGEIGPNRDALRRFKTELESRSFSRVMDRLPHYVNAAQANKGYGIRFTVNASIAGKHTYSRFEAAAAFADAMETHYRLVQGENDRRDVEFRLDIVANRFMVFTKLTDATFRFRGPGRGFAKASLRPTVAHALVWLAGNAENDVFLDPFCGSGTILCERAAYPYHAITGIDRDETALATARRNLPMSGQAAAVSDGGSAVAPITFTTGGLRLVQGDFNELSLLPSVVDVIVTNPPWGDQIKTDDPKALYGAFFNRCALWLKDTGRIIALTPLTEIWEQSAAANGFHTKRLCTLSLHGTLCYVYSAEKKGFAMWKS